VAKLSGSYNKGRVFLQSLRRISIPSYKERKLRDIIDSVSKINGTLIPTCSIRTWKCIIPPETGIYYWTQVYLYFIHCLNWSMVVLDYRKVTKSTNLRIKQPQSQFLFWLLVICMTSVNYSNCLCLFFLICWIA
jgi:hypothetical protein